MINVTFCGTEAQYYLQIYLSYNTIFNLFIESLKLIYKIDKIYVSLILYDLVNRLI